MTTIISATLVKELRERTGAGMMECKKALEASNGDMEHAIEELRKSGKPRQIKKLVELQLKARLSSSAMANKL